MLVNVKVSFQVAGNCFDRCVRAVRLTDHGLTCPLEASLTRGMAIMPHGPHIVLSNTVWRRTAQRHPTRTEHQPAEVGLAGRQQTMTDRKDRGLSSDSCGSDS